jgi:hypothetical protein
MTSSSALASAIAPHRVVARSDNELESRIAGKRAHPPQQDTGGRAGDVSKKPKSTLDDGAHLTTQRPVLLLRELPLFLLPFSNSKERRAPPTWMRLAHCLPRAVVPVVQDLTLPSQWRVDLFGATGPRGILPSGERTADNHRVEAPREDGWAEGSWLDDALGEDGFSLAILRDCLPHVQPSRRRVD